MPRRKLLLPTPPEFLDNPALDIEEEEPSIEAPAQEVQEVQEVSYEDPQPEDPQHYVGSNFDDFLCEERLLDDAEAVAADAVVEFQIDVKAKPKKSRPRNLPRFSATRA